MIEALAKSLPMIIGLILSPIPLIAMFILLLTPGAKHNSFAFLIGWFVGILLIGGTVVCLPFTIETTWKSLGSSGNVQIVIGILILVGVIIVKYKGPNKTDPVKVPKLLKRIDKLGKKRSLSLGFLMCTLNVKNLALVITGAIQIKTVINQQSLESFISMLFFAILASGSMIVPVLIYNLSLDKMDTLFLKWRNLLIKNQSRILMMVLLFFGMFLIYLGVEKEL